MGTKSPRRVQLVLKARWQNCQIETKASSRRFRIFLKTETFSRIRKNTPPHVAYSNLLISPVNTKTLKRWTGDSIPYRACAVWCMTSSYSIDLIHDTRHLCTRLRHDGIIAMSRGFSGGKEVEFVYSWQQKMNHFFIKDDNDNLWVEVIIVTSKSISNSMICSDNCYT